MWGASEMCFVQLWEVAAQPSFSPQFQLCCYFKCVTKIQIRITDYCKCYTFLITLYIASYLCDVTPFFVDCFYIPSFLFIYFYSKTN